jgi:CRISPR-associated protein Cas2
VDTVMVWVLYDVEDDRVRGKVAKECKQRGLERVQYSAFLGRLAASRLDEMAEKFRSLIDEETDRVYVFPFCDKDFARIKMLGIGFDAKWIRGETSSHFF